MATVNEQIVTGRKFRKLVDEATKLWQRISFWTKAVDVEFNDNKTAEIKLGAIDGITDSLVSTSSRIAASAKAVNTLNNNLGGCQLAQEGNDFYIVGADSVRKKLGSGGTLKFNLTISSGYARPTSDIYPSAMVERGVYNITINLANKTGSVGGSASVICYEYIGGGVEQLVAGRASISASITNIQLIE